MGAHWDLHVLTPSFPTRRSSDLFASVWYFRRQWFVSPANTFNQLVAPLIGGILLGALFCTPIVASMDPAFGSGSQVDGLGLVFILGLGIIVLGLAIMIAMALTRPAFFRGATLSRGVSAVTDADDLVDLPFLPPSME